MTPTQMMQSKCTDDWHAATHHAFTDALTNGTIERDIMAGYLQQDYLFVEEFVRLLASAVAHAPTLADGVPGAQFLGLICGPENTYFLRSLEALGVPEANKAAPETAAFQALMAEARTSGSYAQMLAVLSVAEGVYLDWASPFADRANDLPFWLGEWITLHCGAGFEGVVAYLRGQLDKAWHKLDAAEQAKVESLFTRAVQLERAFFDAAWAGFEVAK
ncbi:thiamine biosynthesis protein Thi4 [Actibacterium atlanticum]|uniref:Aminopyrimidine aminohydrolase n=1 Tax=Actibacterium atlanticum TaxID=1461693 RepID=A0A058ZLB5_9RHOB|nr:TenA family protein [Actibacterium atlanticum]KCV81992.1 thiamine biosynthesis protein Thi4 [Actibacterium atlanticum]